MGIDGCCSAALTGHLGFIVLDPPNGFKKEILLFAALAAVICVLLFARWRDWQLAVVLSILGVVLVLSHEPLVFYLPFFLAAVAIHAGSLRRTAAVAVWPTILCGIAAVTVLLHPGNRAMAEKICSSVGERWGHLALPMTASAGGRLVAAAVTCAGP